MLKTIIAKETKEILASTKFVAAFAVCAVLIIVSFYVGARNYKTSVARYEAAVAENLRQFEGLTEWYDISSTRIMMPPEPLATLVAGVSNDIGRLVDVETRGELAPYSSRYDEEPVFAVFRFLDLEFIFQIVLSLFAILLGYDAISGEKEGGTLKLTLSNAVSRSTFILAKLIGSGVALTVSLLAALAIGILILPLMGIALSGDDWLRLGLIVLGGLLYFGAFLTLSVFVSSVTHRTSSSSLILLVIWIMAVTIMPRASVLLAGRAVAVPSVDEISSQKSSFAGSLWKDFRSDLVNYKPKPDESMDDMMNNLNAYMDSLTTARDAKMSEFAERLNEERYNRQVQQQKVAFNLARVSPAAALSLAVSSLAGTSLDIKDRFRDNANAYQETFASFMKEKTGMNVGARMIVIEDDGTDNVKEPIDLHEIPVFRPQPSKATVAIKAASFDLGLLALFNLIFFAASFVSFNRYDAR